MQLGARRPALGALLIVGALRLAPSEGLGRLLGAQGSEVAPADAAADVAPVPPENDDVRDPADCNCDYCVSRLRSKPTVVSRFKCSPMVAPTMDQSNTCKDQADVVRGGTEGIPYDVFCACHCQPGLPKEGSQCVDFTAAELAAASGDGDGCSDPMLPAQVDEAQYASQEGAIAAAATAAKPDSSVNFSTGEQRGQLSDTNQAEVETQRQQELAKLGFENAGMAYQQGARGEGGHFSGVLPLRGMAPRGGGPGNDVPPPA